MTTPPSKVILPRHLRKNSLPIPLALKNSYLNASLSIMNRTMPLKNRATINTSCSHMQHVWRATRIGKLDTVHVGPNVVFLLTWKKVKTSMPQLKALALNPVRRRSPDHKNATHVSHNKGTSHSLTRILNITIWSLDLQSKLQFNSLQFNYYSFVREQ